MTGLGGSQDRVFLLVRNGPGLVGFLGTGTRVVRDLVRRPDPLAVLETPASYAPYQKRWLGQWLADKRTFHTLDAALQAARETNDG